jgi:hypothetical protein|tara:strand:+ start:50 stop:289 length:240 start_codon:yes stop_codon:yes gene_type:complete
VGLNCPLNITGGNMASANDYKDRLEKIIDESIEANTSQIMQGTSTMEDYKYMLGIQHTLVDLKDRLRTELIKLIKDSHE